MQTTLRNEELKGLKTLCTQNVTACNEIYEGETWGSFLKILKDKLKDKVEVPTDSDYFVLKCVASASCLTVALCPSRTDLQPSSVGNMQSRITAKKADRANFSAASRPWDKGGGGHPDPEICRGAVSKTFFSALWASVWSDRKGVLGPWVPPLRRWIWLTEEIKTLAMFTLSVQAQYSSTMLAESTRGYLSVNTPVLCIQAR